MPTYGQTPIVRGGERLFALRAAELGHRRNLPLTRLVGPLETRPVLFRVSFHVFRARRYRVPLRLLRECIRPRLLLRDLKLVRLRRRVCPPSEPPQNQTDRPCE